MIFGILRLTKIWTLDENKQIKFFLYENWATLTVYMDRPARLKADLLKTSVQNKRRLAKIVF